MFEGRDLSFIDDKDSPAHPAKRERDGEQCNECECGLSVDPMDFILREKEHRIAIYPSEEDADDFSLFPPLFSPTPLASDNMDGMSQSQCVPIEFGFVGNKIFLKTDNSDEGSVGPRDTETHLDAMASRDTKERVGDYDNPAVLRRTVEERNGEVRCIRIEFETPIVGSFLLPDAPTEGICTASLDGKFLQAKMFQLALFDEGCFLSVPCIDALQSHGPHRLIVSFFKENENEWNGAVVGDRLKLTPPKANAVCESCQRIWSENVASVYQDTRASPDADFLVTVTIDWRKEELGTTTQETVTKELSSLYIGLGQGMGEHAHLAFPVPKDQRHPKEFRSLYFDARGKNVNDPTLYAVESKERVTNKETKVVEWPKKRKPKRIFKNGLKGTMTKVTVRPEGLCIGGSKSNGGDAQSGFYVALCGTVAKPADSIYWCHVLEGTTEPRCGQRVFVLQQEKTSRIVVPSEYAHLPRIEKEKWTILGETLVPNYTGTLPGPTPLCSSSHLLRGERATGASAFVLSGFVLCELNTEGLEQFSNVTGFFVVGSADLFTLVPTKTPDAIGIVRSPKWITHDGRPFVEILAKVRAVGPDERERLTKEEDITEEDTESIFEEEATNEKENTTVSRVQIVLKRIETKTAIILAALSELVAGSPLFDTLYPTVSRLLGARQRLLAFQTQGGSSTPQSLSL